MRVLVIAGIGVILATTALVSWWPREEMLPIIPELGPPSSRCYDVALAIDETFACADDMSAMTVPEAVSSVTRGESAAIPLQMLDWYFPYPATGEPYLVNPDNEIWRGQRSAEDVMVVAVTSRGLDGPLRAHFADGRDRDFETVKASGISWLESAVLLPPPE